MNAGPQKIQALASREEASHYVAGRLAGLLGESLDRHGFASLVVSGGTTPEKCFQELREMDLDWSRVQVTLTDERCVPVTDPASNEAMVRRELMRGRAAKASFVQVSEAGLSRVPKPYTVCLVGMGEDGHFASIFADLAEKDLLLDPSSGIHCRRIETSSRGEARVTMTLSELICSQQLIMLIFGEKKRELLEFADQYPVGALFARAPVEVVWAP